MSQWQEILEPYSIDQLRSTLESRRMLESFDNRTFTSRPEGLEPGYRASNIERGSNNRVELTSTDLLKNTPSEAIFEEMRIRQKAAYGEDDRIEIIDSSDPLQQRLARSVAAIVPANDVISISDTKSSISPLSMADKFQVEGKPLCSREPFRQQPVSAIGTAFLIEPNVIVSAHHCINQHNFRDIRLVFDFELDGERRAPTIFDKDQFYAVSRFIAGDFTRDGRDWAVAELDRPVNNRLPLVYRREGKTNDGTPVYVIGHPAGLPKKIAGNAQVRINTHKDYFVANLDTYGGNSGSPVFNALTSEVEGILVRGETDFVPLGNCYASLVCPVDGCDGEHCCRMDPITRHFSSTP